MSLGVDTSSIEPCAPPAAPEPQIVLFDFDGVLIHGDSLALYVHERYRRSLWRKLLLLPAVPWLFIGGLISWRLPARALIHISLLGMSERRYRIDAQAFADRLVRRPGLFNRDALLALRRHQAAGDRVIVVTGCEYTLVRALLDQLGLPTLEVLGSQLRPGWVGLRVKMHNVGRQKTKVLAAHGIHAWQRAYSDSTQDIPMLKPAIEPVLVNAVPKRCMRVEKALGRSITKVQWH